MRHNAAGRKLGRKTGHRLAMFRNQLASLVAAERIVTTVSKAKELRPLVEKMVTQGKRDTVHARRLVGRWIQNRELVRKLFEVIAPRFATRPGGYMRIVKLGSRQGDGAEMAVLEFVDFQLKKKAAPPPAAEEAKGKKGKKAAAAEPAEAAKGSEAAAGEGKKARPAAAKKKAPGRSATASKADTKPKGRPSPKSPSAKKTSAPKKTGSS
ncbi:MAG TPA: 50S ribosomal protein L17 [Thermoanaerobaculia bacterium]|nr:50S ribosomal protein L17 [Thermoanaerobaculia bacterium]